MASENTTDSSIWISTPGQGSAHPCILLESDDTADGLYLLGPILIMRSFGNGANRRVSALQSPVSHHVLPGGPPLPGHLSSPVRAPFPIAPTFGEPLACARFESLRETWIIRQITRTEIRKTSLESHTSLGWIETSFQPSVDLDQKIKCL